MREKGSKVGKRKKKRKKGEREEKKGTKNRGMVGKKRAIGGNRDDLVVGQWEAKKMILS